MHISRGAILIILGGLTACFLGASYALWLDFNPTNIPAVIGGGSPTPMVAATEGISNNQINSVSLTVPDSGIVEITAKQLQDAGLMFDDLSAEKLRLTHHGEDVPFLVLGDGDDAAAYFMAIHVEEPQVTQPVYNFQTGTGEYMDLQNAEPQAPGQTVVKQNFIWEEDRFFVERAQGGDLWLGPLLQAPDRWTYTFDKIDPSGGPASLTVELFSDSEGSGDTDHHVEILINDQSVGYHTWDGVRHEKIFLEIKDGILTPGEENTLTILVHDDSGLIGETIYVNSFNLEFMGDIQIENGQVSFSSDARTVTIPNEGKEILVFDITNQDKPVFLTNIEVDDDITALSTDGKQRQYLALALDATIKPTVQPIPKWRNSLRSSGWGADYIAIVADVAGFTDAIEPLLAYRQDLGMRVVAIPLTQIFDEFSDGHRDPQAIKDFLAYTLENWTVPAPRFVLLVGDATYDVKDRLRGKNRNRLPAALIPTTKNDFVISDSWFSQFEGDLPQMAIGRFPAQNAPQLRTMVEKTLLFEQGLPTEDNAWKWRTLLIADDEQVFDESIENVAALLSNQGYYVYRLHMSKDENIRHNIISAINQGIGLVNFVGHGNQFAWGDEAVLQNSDAESLNNGTRPPILTAFSARNGAFADPQTDSLTEILLRTNNGGIVAAIAPSGKSYSDNYLPLADIFFQNLTNKETTIGEALQAVFAESMVDGNLRDAMMSLNLLGDPALRIDRP